MPKVTDVVSHVQCELARIVNEPTDGTLGTAFNPELARRIQNNPKIGTFLPNLVKYHFVATAQITLEVTDAEGLAPSVSFMNAAATHVVGLGGQWNGTQDRSMTLNYAIDLGRLINKRDEFCAGASTDNAKTGLQGDLGLADIVADGLLSLDRSAKANVYSSAGPTPPTVARAITLTGTITLPPRAGGRETINIDSLTGTIVFAPQSAGVQTQGTVTLTGLATLDGHKFLVSWTGGIIAPNAAPDGTIYFTLSGPLVPEPSGALGAIEQRWGFSPVVTLTGTVNNSFQSKSVKLAGVLTAAAGSDYDKLPPIRVDLPETNQPHAAAGAAGPAAKSAGSSGSSSGGTSFGSLVDFVLVYGLNGSPSYTFQNVKGVSGASSPFVSAMRTKTDSLAITFVAACQEKTPEPSQQASSYWGSIGACDELSAALEQGASVGYQNNSLMLLRNFLVRPQ